jgi:hypothetical protein
VSICTLFEFLLIASTLTAQPPSVSSPRAIEFDPPEKDLADVVGYRLEIFPIGSNAALDSPIRLVDFRESSVASSGSVRIVLGTALDGLPDGMYVATLRSLSSQAQSPRSAPTKAFAVTGLADRPAPQLLVLPIPSAASQPAPAAVEDSDSARRLPGLWTFVGIALAVAAVGLWLMRKRQRALASARRRRPSGSRSRRDRVH